MPTWIVTPFCDRHLVHHYHSHCQNVHPLTTKQEKDPRGLRKSHTGLKENIFCHFCIFPFWSKQWTWEGKGDKMSTVLFVLCLRRNGIVIVQGGNLPWRRQWLGSHPVMAENHHIGSTTNDKEWARGRKIWPEKLINLEMQKLKGLGEGLMLQPNLFLILLIRHLSAQGTFGKCRKKHRSSWRGPGTHLITFIITGEYFSSWLPKRHLGFCLLYKDNYFCHDE